MCKRPACGDKHAKKSLKRAALMSLILLFSSALTACQGPQSSEQAAVAAAVTTADSSKTTEKSSKGVLTTASENGATEQAEEETRELLEDEDVADPADEDTSGEETEAQTDTKSSDETSEVSSNTSGEQAEEDGAAVENDVRPDAQPDGAEQNEAGPEAEPEAEPDLVPEPDPEPETQPETPAAPEPIVLSLPRYIDQIAEGAPMGCEAASLLMALQATGHCTGTSYHQFLDTMPYASDGNPNHGFVGTPYANDGNFDGINMPAVTSWGAGYANTADLTGCSEDTLIDQLEQGHAVVVWTSYQFGPTQPEEFWWGSYKTHAHVMTLLGYDPNTSEFYIADPAPGGSWSGLGWVSWSTFTSSFDVMRGAVAVW